MDKKIEREQKKKVRKMAASMLWADFKNLVHGWKVLALMILFLIFVFLPYLKKMENFNGGAVLYFVMWVFVALGAVAETMFNYLPLSGNDIVYYLKCRTNQLAVWMALSSAVTGIVMKLLGADVFFERGLMVLIFLLVIAEWIFIIQLVNYSMPEGTKNWNGYFSTGKKIRSIIYFSYCLILLIYGMVVFTRVTPEENIGRKLLVYLCAYLVLYIFRADVVGWVKFEEYRQNPQRNLYLTPEQQNQQAQ